MLSKYIVTGREPIFESSVRNSVPKLVRASEAQPGGQPDLRETPRRPVTSTLGNMKIAEHIKLSLDAADRKELDQALLFVCLAVDGTSKKTYPFVSKVGERFRKFINDNLDIIELMFGGLNLQETVFPFPDAKGKIGINFADIIYEKFRCNLAHGDELPSGYGISVQIAEHHQQFVMDIANQSMTLPQSAIYALGLACVLAPVNADQKIGSNLYHYRDTISAYVIDRWWGKADCARQIMDFEAQVRVKMDFAIVWPATPKR